MLVRVLIAASERELRTRLKRLVPPRDTLTQLLRSGARGWERALRKSFDVLVTHYPLIPEPVSEALAAIRSLPESPEIIVVCDSEDASQSARLLAAEVGGILSLTLGDDVLADAIDAVIERRSRSQVARLEQPDALARPRLGDFVSRSPCMQRFLDVVQRVVRADSTLLITGETGVGKEHLSRAIHGESPRSQGPFVSVNCGALPETLLESELFGHEEGAFTGANRTRQGRFELAHRGTIFLDEIAEMPFHLQVKLLHVLQTREVHRIGGDAPIHVDTRVIAATNRDLEKELREQRFRTDLYYRLSVVSLTIPPLRDRVEDLEDLVNKHIEHFQTRFATQVTGIGHSALSALQSYNWPGNIRELINIVERAMLLGDGPEIQPMDLPENISVASPASPPGAREATAGNELTDDWLDLPLEAIRRSAIEDAERRYLTALLRATEGRVGETAARAGIQPRSLYEKMRLYDLRKEDFRPRRRKA